MVEFDSCIVQNGSNFWSKPSPSRECRRHNKMTRHILHISGRMFSGGNATGDYNVLNCRNQNDSMPQYRPVTPKVVVCPKCQGYTYAGRTCLDEEPNQNIENPTNTPVEPIKSSDSPFPCCPCCKSGPYARALKGKKYDHLHDNPLVSGPFAEKLAAIFAPENKGKLPIIVGYQKDGTPIYGPAGESSNIIGYTAEGKPIYAPGTGGANEQGGIMGYAPDGTPIYALPNTNPREATVVLGTYVKDGSPIIGSTKLASGMVLKGYGRDGLPYYASDIVKGNKLLKFSSKKGGKTGSDDDDATSGKLNTASSSKKSANANQIEPKPVPLCPPYFSKACMLKMNLLKGVKTGEKGKSKTKFSNIISTHGIESSTNFESGTTTPVTRSGASSTFSTSRSKLKDKEKQEVAAASKIAFDIENFYPRSHQCCVPQLDRIPRNQGWRWDLQCDDLCPNVAFWHPPKYVPGAVALRVARKIKKDRGCKTMVCAKHNFAKCPCTRCKCAKCKKKLEIKNRKDRGVG